ncbi:MAG: putative aminohydrolase SsnA [Candidatus Hodarchaeales archaeon]|jgi:putative selenium metabolism protein SsnA
MNILIKNGVIVTFDSSNRVVKDGAVYIVDDIIEMVGKTGDIQPETDGADKIIDARGRVVMPGLICAHMHFYSAFARGMTLKDSPHGFLEILDKLWWKLDKTLLKEDTYYSALLGYIDAVKSGTTTVIDHHASPSYITGSLDEIERASHEIGVRSCLCYETTNRNGKDEAIEGLKENERFLKKSESSDGMVKGLVGLHASFTLDDEDLEEASKLVQKYDAGVHVHVCEDKADLDDALDKYGMTVVERLDKFDLLTSKSVLAHCVHITEKDYPLLARKVSNIVHNPRSNMNNAVGSLDIFKLLKNGLKFGLGTDGMSADMKDEIIVANLIHKHVQQDNRVGTGEVYEALFKTNPLIVKKIFGVEVGALEVGKKADVLITDYIAPTPLTESNVLGHVLFGIVNSHITTTIINGKVCMENKVITIINEQNIALKCQELAVEAWNRLYD